MRSLRYLVLDENGLVVNAVGVTDPFPEGYWSPIGRYVVCAFGEDNPVPPNNPEAVVNGKPFTYLAVRPISYCWMGDIMNLVTGEVTPAPQPEPVPEEVSE